MVSQNLFPAWAISRNRDRLRTTDDMLQHDEHNDRLTITGSYYRLRAADRLTGWLAGWRPGRLLEVNYPGCWYATGTNYTSIDRRGDQVRYSGSRLRTMRCGGSSTEEFPALRYLDGVRGPRTSWRTDILPHR